MKQFLATTALFICVIQSGFAQDTIVFSANPIEPSSLKNSTSIQNAEVGQTVYFAYSLSAAALREAKPAEVYMVGLKFELTGSVITQESVFPVKKTESNKGIYSLATLKNGRIYGKGVLIPTTGKQPEFYNSPYYYNAFGVNNDLYETLNTFCNPQVSDKKRIAQLKLTHIEIDLFNTMSKRETGSPVIVEMDGFEPVNAKLPATMNFDELMKTIDAQRIQNFKSLSEEILQKAPAHPDYYMNNYDPAITGVSRKEIETLINNMYQKNDPSFTVIKLSNPSEVSIQKDDYDRVLSKSFQVDYMAKAGSEKCAYATIILKAAYLTNGTFGNYVIDVAGYNRCACNQ